MARLTKRAPKALSGDRLPRCTLPYTRGALFSRRWGKINKRFKNGRGVLLIGLALSRRGRYARGSWRITTPLCGRGCLVDFIFYFYVVRSNSCNVPCDLRELTHPIRSAEPLLRPFLPPPLPPPPRATPPSPSPSAAGGDGNACCRR